MNIDQLKKEVEDGVLALAGHIHSAKSYMDLAEKALNAKDNLIAKTLILVAKDVQAGYHEPAARTMQQLKKVIEARQKKRANQNKVVKKRKLITIAQQKKEHRNKLLRDLRLRKKIVKKNKRPTLNNFILDYIEQISHKKQSLYKFLKEMYQMGYRFASATKKWYRV
jgi:hypothetical protein